jgi:hypothetical protein
MFARITSALRSFSLPSIAEVERDYLNGAVSRTDLARRMREVDDGMFRRSHFDL